MDRYNVRSKANKEYREAIYHQGSQHASSGHYVRLAKFTNKYHGYSFTLLVRSIFLDPETVSQWLRTLLLLLLSLL